MGSRATVLLQTTQAPVRQLVCLCVVVLRGATPVFFAMLFASWARAVARRGAPPATTLGPLLLGSGLAGGAKWRVAPGRAIAHQAVDPSRSPRIALISAGRFRQQTGGTPSRGIPLLGRKRHQAPVQEGSWLHDPIEPVLGVRVVPPTLRQLHPLLCRLDRMLLPVLYSRCQIRWADSRRCSRVSSSLSRA